MPKQSLPLPGSAQATIPTRGVVSGQEILAGPSLACQYCRTQFLPRPSQELLTEFGSRIQNMLEEQIADIERLFQRVNLAEAATCSSSEGMPVAVPERTRHPFTISVAVELQALYRSRL